MSGQNQQVIQEIAATIKRLNRAVGSGPPKMAGSSGHTPSQSSVLRNLLEHGPRSSAELSQLVLVTPAAITGIIDRLEKKGLVERLPKGSDRRVTRIALTPAGASQGRSLPDSIEAKLTASLSHLEASKLASLNHGLRQIVVLLETPDNRDARHPRATAKPPDSGSPKI
ncbi:MAG: MarR family transcriptional regulator [Desulfobacterales bacterium]